MSPSTFNPSLKETAEGNYNSNLSSVYWDYTNNMKYLGQFT